MMNNRVIQNGRGLSSVSVIRDPEPPKRDPADAMYARNAIRSNAMVRGPSDALPPGDPMRSYLQKNSKLRLDELVRKMNSGMQLTDDEIAEYMSLKYRNGTIDRGMIAPALGAGGI